MSSRLDPAPLGRIGGSKGRVEGEDAMFFLFLVCEPFCGKRAVICDLVGGQNCKIRDGPEEGLLLLLYIYIGIDNRYDRLNTHNVIYQIIK